MMKILVTGGTGYIGSHTAVALHEAGYGVVLLDNLSNSYGWIADRIRKIVGSEVTLEVADLTDRASVEDCFLRHPDLSAVIHFAALKAVGESVRMPLRYFHNNITGLINLLEVMKMYSVPDLVFSSSCTVYGDARKMPVDETAPLMEPLSPYGRTKRMAEEMIRDVVAAGYLQATLLRYFNPVGAHPSGLIGELPLGVPNNLMPYITQTAIGEREILRVFGNDYNTPDGTAVRDYLHVTDLAQAHVRSVDRMLKGEQQLPVEVFNLGTGNGISVLEMLNAFTQYNDVPLNWEYAPRRAGDIEAIWADPALAHKKLKWRTQMGVKEMVTTAWAWEQRLKMEGYDPKTGTIGNNHKK
jgi:UDP-glucose 4-epimerase